MIINKNHNQGIFRLQTLVLIGSYRRREFMIRRINSGYRLYSRKKNPKTGRRRNLGTFKTLAAAKRHERAVQFFKRAG